MVEVSYPTRPVGKKAIFFFLSLIHGLIFALGCAVLVTWHTFKEEDFIQRVAEDSLLVYEVRRAVIGIVLDNLELPVENSQSLSVERLLPEQQISSSIEVGLDSLINWLNDPNVEKPESSLDLRPVIDYLDSPDGKIALLPVLQALPPCESNQSMIDPVRSTVVCIQNGKDISQVVDAQVDLVRKLIPEQLSLEGVFEQTAMSEQIWETLFLIKAVFQKIRVGLNILWGIYFILLLTLLILNPLPLLKRIIDLRLSFYHAGVFSVLIGFGFYFLPIYLRKTSGFFENVHFLPSIVQTYILAWTERWIWVVGGILAFALTLTILDLIWSSSQKRGSISKVVNHTSRPRYRKEFR